MIRIVIILILAGCAGAGIRSYYLYKQQYTGKEWLSHQKSYFKQLETFSDTVDKETKKSSTEKSSEFQF